MEKRDRIFIDLKDREVYDNLTQDIFKGKSRKEQFLFSMALGFRRGTKKDLSKKEGFFLLKDLHPKDEALIYCVAICDSKSADILSNLDKVYQIAEEYACAGIKILSGKIGTVQFGKFTKQFEREIYEIYKDAVKKYKLL